MSTVTEIKNIKWVQDLALLTDFTRHLYELNINFKGEIDYDIYV